MTDPRNALLYGAAELIREQVRLASRGPWTVRAAVEGAEPDELVVETADGHSVVEVQRCPEHPDRLAADARYVELMHPPVGLAVAALLELAARFPDPVDELVACAEAIARSPFGDQQREP